MIYLLTYRSSDNEQHQLEWVAPQAWSLDTIRRTFQRRFPAATLLSLVPQP